MVRLSITDDNVPPLIELGIDMSAKVVDMTNMFLYTFFKETILSVVNRL